MLYLAKFEHKNTKLVRFPTKTKNQKPQTNLYVPGNSSYQTVVVVRNSYNLGFEGLKGKKYCHPGFKYHTLWTPRARKEFENVILQSQLEKSCSLNTSQSYIEHELQTVSEFFGDSCRPGPWTDDSTMEENLSKSFNKNFIYED